MNPSVYQSQTATPLYVNLLQRVVCEIADREGVDPSNLSPPLYSVVDTDALDAFVTDSESRQDGANPSMGFEYQGYSVTIDASGSISVSGISDTTEESSRGSSGNSRENLSAEIDHRERAMRNVAHIIAARGRPFVEHLNGLLEVVRKDLGMDYATLSYVDGDSYVFEAVDVPDTADIEAGDIVPIEDTVCKRVIATEQSLSLTDIAVDAPELADSATGLSSYIGVPVFVDGEVYGTFCFYDTDPRSEAFSDWDMGFIELLSNWVSSELEQRKRERALHAATTERPPNVT